MNFVAPSRVNCAPTVACMSFGDDSEASSNWRVHTNCKSWQIVFSDLKEQQRGFHKTRYGPYASALRQPGHEDLNREEYAYYTCFASLRKRFDQNHCNQPS